MPRSQPLRRPLRVESLEGRWLMAGNVMAQMLGDVLLLTGDSRANSILVTQNNSGAIEVTGLETTRVIRSLPNGFTGVNDIVIDLKQKDDTVVITHLDLPGNLTITTAAGDDLVTIGDSYFGQLAPVSIGGDLTITTAAGKDRVEEYNLHVAQNQLIDTGAGNDRVQLAIDYLLDIPDFGEPIEGFDNGGVSVDGNLTVLLGAGNDWLDMAEIKIGASLAIFDQGGKERASLFRVQSSSAAIDLGGSVRDRGQDDLDIFESQFDTLAVLLGRGSDILAVGDNTVTTSTTLDGGPERDAYFNAGGNSFANLSKTSFEFNSII